MKNHQELAQNYFQQGYNCAQSVALAFHEEMKLTPSQTARMVCGFGGGMGRLREVCGAVSGGVFVISMLVGYEDPANHAGKAALYKTIQEFAHSFEAVNHSIICRELLGLPDGSDNPVPAQRTAAYYQVRPCGELVGDAAKLVAELLPLILPRP